MQMQSNHSIHATGAVGGDVNQHMAGQSDQAPPLHLKEQMSQVISGDQQSDQKDGANGAGNASG